MAHILVRIKNLYFVYSTIVDDIVAGGMSLPEYREWSSAEYGRRDHHDLEDRIERVNKKGTSSRNDSSAAESLSGNRCGGGEKKLSLNEIYEKYKPAKQMGQREETFAVYDRLDQDKFDTHSFEGIIDGLNKGSLSGEEEELKEWCAKSIPGDSFRTGSFEVERIDNQRITWA